MWVRGDTDLIQFRARWNGAAMLRLLPGCGGRLLVTWPVGVGKSHNFDDVVEAACTGADYKLVLAFSPTHAVIDERRLIQSPPTSFKTIRLNGRPYDDCGGLQDTEWRDLETRGLGLVGREKICGKCPHLPTCPWPGQFTSSNLSGTRVIFAPTAYLGANPYFVDFVAELVGVSDLGRVLVLIDESDFLDLSFRRHVTARSLTMLADVAVTIYSRQTQELAAYIQHLLAADTNGLRDCPEWRLPKIPSFILAELQRKGIEKYGDRFLFPLHDLLAFGRSPIESREKTDDGTLVFSLVPEVKADFVTYSATASASLIRYRTGWEFVDYFEDYQFLHQGTRWYNLASTIGTRGHFKKNAKQILDFFAELIISRLLSGKKVLLVSKKTFVNFCKEELEKRFRKKGLLITVLADNFKPAILSIANVVPIIHYGVVGVNLFNDYDCVYCLNSFFINDKILSDFLQETRASDHQIPVTIRARTGRPRRRTAFAERVQDQIYDVHSIASEALYYLEMGPVIQAVGRARPYTSPVEIITFQCSDHPEGAYNCEFNNLAEARRFFGILSDREQKLQETIRLIREGQARGLSRTEVAKATGLSRSTVQRYWDQK